ncbi:hypothetical protein LWC34_46440 [Kibdelosporangium philippinense]|uniref:Hint domain-containing protein n=1 Tax=Kibdelosporangium philippinense TaxID=211113 RepID=A0ABS8ZT71_9PSEU|nr:polymorphic toxin-type HINT domain-containing protein [Kibdelosporangium philippinense]MCE7010195.1 hypothetical protein [Kibdelosporangium philippinense]
MPSYSRKYGDDVGSSGRKYGSNSKWGRGSDFKSASGRYFAISAAERAAERAAAAARAAAARRAAMKAVTDKAKAAIAHAAKNNPLPVLKAATTPKIAAKDLISSAATLPARKVASIAENVQDGNKVWAIVKATIIKPGTVVVQSVAEQAVTDYANSQQPGLGDALAFAGPALHRGNIAASAAGLRAKGKAKKTSCDSNSFDPNTPVLMADGSQKAISDIKVGDRVLATDPTTGRTASREVTDVRSHVSERQLVEVNVGDGKVVATDEHPFWVASDNRWSHAIDLKPGHRLETADHRDATVTGTRSWSEVRLVYNLTVDTDHTYYVVAGTQSVLVHNDDEGSGPADCDVKAAAMFHADILAKVPNSKRSGASEVVIAVTGEQYEAGSATGFKPYLVPKVSDILDRHTGPRGNGHGQCGLVQCLSAMYEDGVDPRGATVAAYMVRSPGNRNYGHEMGPCDSCAPFVEALDLKFVTKWKE